MEGRAKLLDGLLGFKLGVEGRALITRDAMRAGAVGLAPGERKERDLSWQDWTVPVDVSGDGKTLLHCRFLYAGWDDFELVLAVLAAVCQGKLNGCGSGRF